MNTTRPAAGNPLTHLARRIRLRIFRDGSRLDQDLRFARACADGVLHPQVLLEGLRDRDGRVVDFLYREVNTATCDYLLLTRTDLIGRTLLQTSPNIVAAGLMADYVDCLDRGEPFSSHDFSYDNEITGDRRRYDIRATPVGVDLLSLSWEDVTDRAEVAQRLSDSERRLTMLATDLGDITLYLRDGRILWVDASVERWLGQRADQLIGRTVLDFVHPDDQAAYSRHLARIAAGKSVFTRLRIVIGGAPHWIHVHAMAFYNDHGAREGAVVSIRVIDDKVAAETAVAESRRKEALATARYQRLMENSPIGVALLTPAGRFDTVNSSLCDFFGYSAETLRDMTWQELTAPAFLDADVAKVGEILSGRIDSYRMIKQYVHADGHLIWGDLSVGCLRDGAGRVQSLISQISDITAAREAQQRIALREERNRALSRRLKAQSDLVQAELRSAAAYVASLLPGDLAGRVRVSSRFLPSRELGGDCFDYAWVDDDHLVVYLIDVSGHGIEPALLSVSVHNLLRSGTLSPQTMLAPEETLAELNTLFQAEKQNDHHFTIWYGVYEPSSRTLRYASAGHPPALAFPAAGADRGADRLSSAALPIGLFADIGVAAGSYPVPAGGQILLCSDGAFEITLADGRQWSFDEFAGLCARLLRSPDFSLDDLLADVQSLTPDRVFTDDCSLVHLRFD